MTSAVAVPSDDIAPVTMGPSRGNDRDQTIITTTATGAKVDMSELLSSDPLGSQRKPVDQSLMETRMDFHTHPRSLALAHTQLADWRTHEKLRTVGALLVVCLNLGTEPPDVVKPSKRAVMEAWVDPTAPVDMPTQEELALQAANGAGQRGSTTKERSPMRAIGESILRQFEHIQKHAKYKPLLDCCMEDLRKYCVQFRRVAKEERLLFYYNGHGVPRPTPSGDLWVFNRQFTQYIPVNSMELMSWIGTPCLYVWDCAHAMNIVKAFEKNAKLRDVEIARIRHAAEANGMRLPLDRTDPRAMSNITSNIAAMMAGPMHPSAANGSTGISGQGQAPHQQNGQQQQQQPAPGSSAAASAAAGSAQGNSSPVNPALINLALLPSMHHEDIHFAATRSDELLPTNPELPADLFTSCLTTPVKMALRFWVTRNPNNTKVTLDMCEKLPGSVQDRRTPLGEINWIFTSITDSIAWSTLPREQFRKLFRQDVVVASMYRNFMLADRVMRFYGVHPQCSPSIPPTHKHPLWDSLDLEIDMCLQQLPRLLKEDERRRRREERARRSGTSGSGTGTGTGSGSQSRYPSANSAASEFHLPLVPKLAIASGFNTMASRHGPRIGLGGAIESEDEDASDSGSDDGIGGRSLGLGHAGGGYISSTYYSNQLYAFEVWLQHAATVVSKFVSDQKADEIPQSLSTCPPDLEPPDELPAVLQVLLSQQYRRRALILLYRFMNLGPWAVDQAMAVGIYPYMSKLLGSTTTEIREILILVWARLSAVDMALHPELLKNSEFNYFVTYLASNIHMQYEPVDDKVRLCDTVSAACAFTLTMLCRDMPAAQKACFDERVLDYFLLYLQKPDNGTEERACLRTWVLLCLAELWKGQSDAKWMAMTYKLCVITSYRNTQAQKMQQQHDNQDQSLSEIIASTPDDENIDDKDAQDLLIQMAFHRSPVVRASAIYATNTLLQNLQNLGVDPAVQLIVRNAEAQLFPMLLQAALDGSPMVRREVAQAIANGVFASYMRQSVEAVARVVGEELRDQRRARQQQNQAALPSIQQRQQQQQAGSGIPADDVPEVSMDLLVKLYKIMLRLCTDPHPDIAQVAREACDVLMQCYARSRMFFDDEAALDQALHKVEISRTAAGQTPILGFLRTTAVGDALLGHQPHSAGSGGELSPELGSVHFQPNHQQQTTRMTIQQQQQRQAQRRQSAHTGLHGSSASTLGSPRARGDMPSSVASHRYTMHFTQQQSQQYQNQQQQQATRSPSAGVAGNMHRLESALRESQVGRDRFAAMSDSERMDASRRLAEVEAAWLEWGRSELRAGSCESTLVDWAGAHFTEFDISLFANITGPLQGSVALVESRERHRRVDRMETNARITCSGAGSMKWTDPTTVATIAEPASATLLHPLEPHAIVATRRGNVSVYDWEMQAQVAQYSIGSKADAVCSLHLINPLGQARLLVATADGMVRVLASHAPDFSPPPAGHVPAFPKPRLLTAFAALPWAATPAPNSVASLGATTLLGSSQRLRAHTAGNAISGGNLILSDQAALDVGGTPLVTAWNQRSGVLFAGGNDKEIRVWDINTEMCIEEIAVSSMGGITCISQDGVSGNFFAVGNRDGVVRVLDRRLDACHSVVANWSDHRPHSVRNVFMRPGQVEVVSASSDGTVRYWDLRHASPYFTLNDTHTDHRLEHMLVHENAPVTLTASDATVKLWNQRGTNIGVVTAAKHTYASSSSYMKSFAGYAGRGQAHQAHQQQQQQQVRVDAVAMHPYLAVALMVTDDGRVSYIQPKKGNPRPASIAVSTRSNTIS